MPDNTPESWTFDDDGTTWHHDPGTGGCVLDAFHDLGPPAGELQGRDLADWVGAHYWQEAGGAVLYPGEFLYSPVSGTKLPKLADPSAADWMPPRGNGPALACQGLWQTPLNLSLRPREIQERPDSEIPVPPSGDCVFMAGRFATHAALLLAVNPRKGLLHAYLRHARQWLEVRKSGLPLPESSLDLAHWGAARADATGRRLFLPTDTGLAVLDFNPMALRYAIQGRIPGHCLGAPAFWDGRIVVPCRDEAGNGGLWSVSPDLATQEWLACEGVKQCGPLRPPLVESRQILWLGQGGQVMLKHNGQGELVPSFIPWPEDYSPCFEFGCPYQLKGELWQLCRHLATAEYWYVRLGFADPEKHKAQSPRFSSGHRLFRQQAEILGEPWGEREKDLHPLRKANETVIPLLEAANKTVLCVRFQSELGYPVLFSQGLDDLAEFELLGDGGWVPFFARKMKMPWQVRPFVYEGHLYLYDSDASNGIIPGWELLDH